MAIRGLIIYFSSILLMRFNRRFTGIRTPFNFILYIMLGSISAVAIIGSVPFLPVYGVILLLMILNRFIASFGYYSSRFEKLVKGPIVLLVKDGESGIIWQNIILPNVN